jgi:hypothetical protein
LMLDAALVRRADERRGPRPGSWSTAPCATMPTSTPAGERQRTCPVADGPREWARIAGAGRLPPPLGRRSRCAGRLHYACVRSRVPAWAEWGWSSPWRRFVPQRGDADAVYTPTPPTLHRISA